MYGLFVHEKGRIQRTFLVLQDRTPSGYTLGRNARSIRGGVTRSCFLFPFIMIQKVSTMTLKTLDKWAVQKQGPWSPFERSMYEALVRLLKKQMNAHQEVQGSFPSIQTSGSHSSPGGPSDPLRLIGLGPICLLRRVDKRTISSTYTMGVITY